MRLAVFSLTSLIGDGPVICTMKLGFLYPRRCASSVGPPLSAQFPFDQSTAGSFTLQLQSSCERCVGALRVCSGECGFTRLFCKC